MSEPNRPSRLISIDIMKGIGIIGMLFSHAFFKGVWFSEGNAAVVVGEHAPWVIPFALPLIIVGTWPGFFILMTGILNSYLTAKRLEKGRTIRQAVSPMYVNAVLFLLIHVFMVTVLHDYRPDLHHPGQGSAGLFGNLVTGNGLKISSGQWYIHTMLSMLAFAEIYFALSMTYFFRKDKWKNRQSLTKILLIQAVLVLVLSAVISGPSYNLVTRLVEVNTLPANVAIFILQSLSASQLDLFPLAAYGSIGMIVGLFLFHDRERKDLDSLRGFLNRTGTVALLTGVLLIVIRVLTAGTGPVDAIFIYEPYPVHLAVFNMGLILFVLSFAMKRFEYAPLERLQRICDRTLFIRAAGMLTLTLYVLEFPVRFVLSYAAHGLFGESSVPFPESFLTFQFDSFMLNPGAIALFMVVIMSLWLLLIALLIRTGFVGSFEWIFVRIANRFRPLDKSEKAHMSRILYPLNLS
ncbi:hypothetical protein [Spirochaeta isovalerica]|uniref:Acyltransferase 3 domain-containing protein n=1 Tax=Spirochaeta isovalerica TaxID=150 RepID=A0A841R4K6_9SPIO|nr:hypothetical protein [Spirochaeta isovalerica]MBB6480064.1 hypothetical protein [Spirochaeta isovalerica]